MLLRGHHYYFVTIPNDLYFDSSSFKWVRVKNQNIDILRSFDASKAQSWIINISDDEEIEEDGSLGIGGDAVGVDRKLHEDDFVLDEEQVEGGENFEFNSDEEGFI
ncbi:hypothetical protein Tco_0320886 [Tanacetum coccineum]